MDSDEVFNEIETTGGLCRAIVRQPTGRGGDYQRSRGRTWPEAIAHIITDRWLQDGAVAQTISASDAAQRAAPDALAMSRPNG